MWQPELAMLHLEFHVQTLCPNHEKFQNFLSYKVHTGLDYTRTNSHDFIWTSIPYKNTTDFYFLPMRLVLKQRACVVLCWHFQNCYRVISEYKLRSCRTTRESPRFTRDNINSLHTHYDI